MFDIIQVPDDAPEMLEQIGTKDKFWFDERRRIFKAARPTTGEDWAEKVACELCSLLDIPHANYELATWKGKRGVVAETIVPQDGRLILGNELLPRVFRDYPHGSIGSKAHVRVKQHTVRRVLAIIKALQPPIGFTPFNDVSSAAEVFIGYLMLDAWIGNQDRHHQNWGLILAKDRQVHLASTFDHASSLGRNEPEKTKQEILTTKDMNRVKRYMERARSALFADESSDKPLTTLEAFTSAARFHGQAALAWLKHLEDVSLSETERILRQVPPSIISEESIEFAQRMLVLNRSRLLNCTGMLLT